MKRHISNRWIPAGLASLVAVLAMAMLSAPSAFAEPGAAPVVTGLAASATSVPSGARIHVTGTMTTSAQPKQTAWTDPTLVEDITSTPMQCLSSCFLAVPSNPMVDLVEGDVTHANPADPLTFQVKLGPAVGADTGPLPYLWYQWPFQLDKIWYFVDFDYASSGTGTFAWKGSWFYCKNFALGSNCVHGTTPSFPVTWDVSTRTLTGTVPLGDLAKVQPDGALTQDAVKQFSSQYPPESGFDWAGSLDEGQDFATWTSSLTVPLATVSTAIAPSDTSPEGVTFTSNATVTTSKGSNEAPFAGDVSTAGLAPGSYTLFVQACFGPCTTDEIPITVS
ncbi:MAG: hypothetical protein ABR600_05280 [Actinomycetota bacterium]